MSQTPASYAPDHFVEGLKRALREAQGLLKEQDAAMQQLQEVPLQIAAVLHVGPVHTVIGMGDKQIRVVTPKTVKIAAGDTVVVLGDSLQIVERATPVPTGSFKIVKRVLDASCEVDDGGDTRVVLFSGKAPEVGDRVMLDQSQNVVAANRGKDDGQYVLAKMPDVTWDDIGGLHEAKRTMIEAVELPFQHRDIFKHYGKKPIKGVLLYGPPGCGKTMLAKATAAAVARVHGKETTDSGFIYIKGPEILDKFVGASEAKVRSLFQRSREHKAKHGYPAVIFIDEAEAIMGKRGSGVSSDMERTIVPMFLAEMDGLEDAGAMVLLATNRSDMLDPAIVRDGRVDRKVRITRPNLNDAREIFAKHLAGVPLADLGIPQSSILAADELFSSKHGLYEVKTETDTKVFGLSNLASGAMIAGIVDRATSLAIDRDISKGAEKPTGVTAQDIQDAVRAVRMESLDLNHTEDLSDFVHDYKDEVVGVQKLRQAA